jgi:hypothetical protein
MAGAMLVLSPAAVGNLPCNLGYFVEQAVVGTKPKKMSWISI